MLYTICTEITTSTVDIREETGGRPVQKAKVNTLNIIHYKIRSNYDVEMHVCGFREYILA